jgi:tRNA U34 2-thiouridine synthase MnmA/TrmU
VNADKKDTRDLLIGVRRFKQFLMHFLPAQPGDMVELSAAS